MMDMAMNELKTHHISHQIMQSVINQDGAQVDSPEISRHLKECDRCSNLVEIINYAQEISAESSPEKQQAHPSRLELSEIINKLYEGSLPAKEAANFLNHLASCLHCFKYLETVFEETFSPLGEKIADELQVYSNISLAKTALNSKPPINMGQSIRLKTTWQSIKKQINKFIESGILRPAFAIPVLALLIVGFFVGQGPFRTWRAITYTDEGINLLKENWTITDEDLRPASIFPLSMFSTVHGSKSTEEEKIAISKFNKALTWDDENVAAKHGLAMYWYFTSQLAKADSLLNTLLAHDSLDYKVWNITGLVESKKENDNKALQAFETAININPDFTEAAYNRALLLQKSELLPEAKEAWQHYLTIDQDSDWAKIARKRIENLQSIN